MSDEDHKAIFAAWLQEHSSSVIQVARAYTLTQEECQDLAQEILLQAWRSLGNFQGRSSPATWFYRVALHTAMKWQRQDRQRRLRQQPWLDVHTQIDAYTDPTKQAEQRELVERIYQAIHQLSKTDVAILLLYLDNLSYKEMASVLGLSENNVGVRLSRAKQALEKLLASENEEGRSNEPR